MREEKGLSKLGLLGLNKVVYIGYVSYQIKMG
jgi:hypothetical protein